LVLGKVKKSDKLYVRIAEHINSKISDGTFKVGDRLPAERDIAEQMSVSRASVREALAILEVLGVVEIKVGDGSYVRKKMEDFRFELNKVKNFSLYELIEARAYIEGMIVEIAVEKATEEDIRKLQNNISEMESIVDDDHQVDRFFELGMAFHEELAKIVHNEVITNIVNTLINQNLSTTWKLLNRKILSVREAREHQIEEHQIVFQAIKERDKETARKAIQMHLHHLEDLLTML
jgi:GntR family transcriptional regulator, transcriptional repressor for pyruvate dehydrogenase complex